MFLPTIVEEHLPFVETPCLPEQEPKQKPKIAHGDVIATSPTTFVATFTIDKLKYTFRGAFHRPLENPFEVKEAKLEYTYAEPRQIQLARIFSGLIGPQAISLQFEERRGEKGPLLTGNLDVELKYAISVVGNGNWSTS
ncbi:hypothetical protein CPB83DRAFT_582371 [Crepidotus variabilis]|uniref:Uncharacterized protein n=1 Tax=Crepidotus variabilis TaxID=179855 RepID=A0A9P6EN35_9AGAR|nr:hypothetical protein CPB83DRAFT_582371 [Crepidotus variabilis]